MNELRVSLKGKKDVQKAIKLLGQRAQSAVGSALWKEATDIMTASKALVPVDLATLKNSATVQLPKHEGSSITVTMGYGGAASQYAVYIHEGTGPAVGRPQFMPPSSAFEEWGARHGFPPGSGFILARSVGRRGLKPRKFLERPFNEAKNGMLGRITQELWRQLK